MILSPEQLMIKQTAEAYAKNHLLPNSQNWSEHATFPNEAIKTLGELGFMGLLVPTSLGGSDIGHLAYVLAMEAIAYGDASVSTIMGVHNSVASMPLLAFGNTWQQETFLKPMATGKHLGAFALSEPQAGSDALNISSTATKLDDYYILNGTKQFVTSGNSADTVIVFAVTDNTNPIKIEASSNQTKLINKKRLSAFIVPTNTPGYEVLRIEKKMGQHASHTAQIGLNNLKIPKSHLLGNEGEGYMIALSNLECGRLGIAAQALGIARRALDLSVAYAKERVSFNKPIIKHQAITFKLADMATQIEAAKHLIYHAANQKEHHLPATKEAAMAKLFASEMAENVCKEAIQVFGGYGYLCDFPLEQLYRDVRVTTIYEGTSDIQKIIISKALDKEV